MVEWWRVMGQIYQMLFISLILLVFFLMKCAPPHPVPCMTAAHKRAVVYNSVLLVYVLLASFPCVGESERAAVELMYDHILCFVSARGRPSRKGALTEVRRTTGSDGSC